MLTRYIRNFSDKRRRLNSIIMRFVFDTLCHLPAANIRPFQLSATMDGAISIENYFAIDPVLKPENFIQGHLPWTDELFTDAQQLWDGARDHGLRKGITQCLMLPNHALGFLSVSCTSLQAHSISSEEIELRLQMLVQMALTTLLRFEHETVMPPEMKFSKREREILKWTAEGKTSAEIAIILSISENTVNFHQKNMQKKFNAPNKIQIACYAAATGLI